MLEIEKRLSDVLSEFARTLGTDFPIHAILDQLVAEIVHVLPISAAGVALISDTADPHYVAASDASALRFEQLQTELGEGPCTAAYETGEAVVVPDLRVEARFPEFARRAIDEGLIAVFAFPLRHGENRLGALDLYRETAGGLDAAELAAAQTLADVTAAYLLNARARDKLQASSVASAHELEMASRSAAIVEWSSDAMIGKTLEGIITDWNSGAERMYGYARREALGCSVSMLVPPSDPEELPLLLERVGRGEGVAHFETRRIRKDGEIFDVSVSMSPIRDQLGAIIGAASVTRDISERKQAEAAVRELEDRMHQSERLESIGQLAGGIAHDFNNLLAAIMNYAALITDGLTDLSRRHGLADDDIAVTLAGDAAEITAVAVRAAQLTRQLLIFSHRDVATPEVLDVNAVVADMEKLLRRIIGEGIELVTKLRPDVPRTKVDRGQLEQVIVNLAVNARDSMGGGGKLLVETASFDVENEDAFEPLGPGRYVRLTVSDTGSGMSPEVVDRVFEPFFTTKAKGDGSGLGLATVYGIARRAGGNVVVYSEPGLGTSVRVNFPATQDELPEAVADPAAGSEPSQTGETILLVEDEDMVREPARRMLARFGYRVLTASNADEGLAVAAAHDGDIDLLLTDVVMPDRSGRELAAELLKLRPLARVVYMSGYSHDLIVHQGMVDAGVNLIEKPFSADKLRQQIRDALDAV